MDFTYILTLLCLTIYALFSYYQFHHIIAFQSLYLILLIIYISINTQQSQKFKYCHIKNVKHQNKNKQSSQNQNNPNIEKQQQKPKNICKICNKIKPQRYYHCRRCNICIYQMDHHCDWLNCCVGQFNFKIYFHVLCNFQLLSILCIYIMISQMYEKWEGNQWITVSLVLRLTFILFILWQCTKMLINFCQMVRINQTLIQSYKLVVGMKKTKIHKLQQIFGEQFNINWFIPTFASGKFCNIYEKVYPIYQSRIQDMPNYDYADQYIYGSDDQSDLALNNKKQ